MVSYKPVYECGDHDFTTEDYKEYREHLASAAHTVSGSTKCSDCNERCENDPNEQVVLQPGQVAPARCPGCMKKEEDRVLARIKKEGRTKEVLEIVSSEDEVKKKK